MVEKNEKSYSVEIPQNIVDFYVDHSKHVRGVQFLIKHVCDKLIEKSLLHDASKYEGFEASYFVEHQDSLKNAKSGDDKEYSARIMQKGIQAHFSKNAHHAEYYKKNGGKMPFTEIVSMYFDWTDRAVQSISRVAKAGGDIDEIKNGGHGDFWETNLQKLKDNDQSHAVAIVEELAKEFPPLGFFKSSSGAIFSLDKRKTLR